jgi:hypothetical protein
LPSQLLPEYRVVRTIRSPDHVIYNDLTGWRLTSAAFEPTDDGLVSVDLEQLLTEDGLPPLAMYPAVTKSVAAATQTVAAVRGHNLEVIHDPVCNNWYHGGISGKPTKSVRRKLAATAGFLVPINEEEAKRLFTS